MPVLSPQKFTPVVAPADRYVDFAIYAKLRGFEPRLATLLRHEHADIFPAHIRRGPRMYVRQGPLDAFFAAVEERTTATAQ